MKKRLLVIAVLLMAAFVCITVLNGMDTELSPSEPSGSGTARVTESRRAANSSIVLTPRAGSHCAFITRWRL